MAAETGVTIEQARRLWRALGFPDRGLEVAFTIADADAVSTLVGQVEAGHIDFDMAVTLTRAVGQTMARLADWEVATLVHRVQEIESGNNATGSRARAGLRADRRDERAVRAAADLRLAPAPRRGRDQGRGAGCDGWAPTTPTSRPPR